MRKIRVLWFANTPSLASRKLGMTSYLGGWISSLEKEIAGLPEIELALAFPHSGERQTFFSMGATRYFPIPMETAERKFRDFAARWRHQIEPVREIDHYREVVDEFKPDLIHIFGSERSFGLIAKHCKVPIIMQIQGNLTVYYDKWFSGISYSDVLRYCNKKNLLLGYGIFHSYYLFRKRAIREREILAHCKHIIGRTEWDNRISRILAPGSVYYHCDELLREQFHSVQWNNPVWDEKTFLSTLSPLTYKGLETILKTARLLKTLNQFKFSWHVAGITGKEEIIRITERVTKLRFRDNNVLFRGSLAPDSLAESLAACDAYIHPSHIENSPNSVCEAMLTGTPVIATASGGTPTIVKDGEEGLLVQDGDPYAMAGAVLQLLRSPELKKRLSENARRRALERHNPETIRDRLITIYQEVLDSVK